MEQITTVERYLRFRDENLAGRVVWEKPGNSDILRVWRPVGDLEVFVSVSIAWTGKVRVRTYVFDPDQPILADQLVVQARPPHQIVSARTYQTLFAKRNSLDDLIEQLTRDIEALTPASDAWRGALSGTGRR